MKVKKYVAPTMPEAMKKVRQELGSDAVILNSKEIVNGGFLGLFKKRNIEVVAALDPQPEPASDHKQKTVKRPAEAAKRKTEDSVMSEIRQLKKMVKEQSMQQANYPTDYQEVYDHLLEQETDADLAKEVMDHVLEKHRKTEITPEYEAIVRDTKREVERRLGMVSYDGITASAKVIQFVGPTGVGKTTTIAKLAASSVLTYKKRVALITADTYRIAAVDQLKTYANILNVPLEIAYNAGDYQAALRKFADYDLVLVDTAGRNFRDGQYVRELQQIVRYQETAEMFLVLSLTAKPADIMDIYDQFAHLPIKEVIFTKADETQQFGSMLNIALKKATGIAFITNGQDVPDDIIDPSPKNISEYIMGGFPDA
ncbi:flagellar biosynthesis protein FlhF [Lentibacillus lipolyticus]|nr:flagellar biosynthesis protein FlhF [Lentibacillus lipolyticus]